jgi:hypothetical protein
LLGDFNARITTNQGIIFNNDFNANLLWSDKDLVLAKYKRKYKDLVENLFGIEPIEI